MIRHLRERALKCIAFIKILSCDLEICSKYGMSDDHVGDELLTKLINSGHVLVSFLSSTNPEELCVQNNRLSSSD